MTLHSGSGGNFGNPVVLVREKNVKGSDCTETGVERRLLTLESISVSDKTRCSTPTGARTELLRRFPGEDAAAHR